VRMVGSPLRPTDEQRAILDAVATGETTAISAAAGTGKTSTLRIIAAARPRTRMLYLAYNKAIQVEAERSFAPNVSCKTAHALAYREFGAPMRSRLNGRRRMGAENAKVLGIRSAFGFSAERVFSEGSLASMAMGMVARFCRSSASSLEPWMLSAPEGVSDDEARALAQHVLPYARKAWSDLTAGPVGQLKPTHDVYLKQWQLSGPELTGWDVILYDEAQDADPCISDVVERQRHAQLVAVGDSAQAIYGWRGAGDFLSRLNTQHRLRLTQSWRLLFAVFAGALVRSDDCGRGQRVAFGGRHRHAGPGQPWSGLEAGHVDRSRCRAVSDQRGDHQPASRRPRGRHEGASCR
jgi:hypothetical protein